jgi:hypothetical protein
LIAVFYSVALFACKEANLIEGLTPSADFRFPIFHATQVICLMIVVIFEVWRSFYSANKVIYFLFLWTLFTSGTCLMLQNSELMY